MSVCGWERETMVGVYCEIFFFLVNGFTVRLIIDGNPLLINPSFLNRPVNLTSTSTTQAARQPVNTQAAIVLHTICRGYLSNFYLQTTLIALELCTSLKIIRMYPILPCSRGTSSRRGFHPLKFVRLVIHMNRTRGHSPLELLSSL